MHAPARHGINRADLRTALRVWNFAFNTNASAARQCGKDALYAFRGETLIARRILGKMVTD